MLEARLVWRNGSQGFRRERNRPKGAIQRPTVEVESIGRLYDVKGLTSGTKQCSEAGARRTAGRIGVDDGDEGPVGSLGAAVEYVHHSVIGRLGSEDADSGTVGAPGGEGVGDAEMPDRCGFDAVVSPRFTCARGSRGVRFSRSCRRVLERYPCEGREYDDRKRAEGKSAKGSNPGAEATDLQRRLPLTRHRRSPRLELTWWAREDNQARHEIQCDRLNILNGWLFAQALPDPTTNPTTPTSATPEAHLDAPAHTSRIRG